MPRSRCCGRSWMRPGSGAAAGAAAGGAGAQAADGQPDSGTPSSKEPIGAKERRRAERQESERERRKDRRRGGQPGHPGRGLARDPDPGERKDADPPAQCRRCGAGLEGAAPAAPGWAQVVDVQVTRTVTEWTLPGLQCPCCGTATIAAPPSGAHAGVGVVRPALNAAAVVLASYGNVPPERAAHVMDMLLGVPVSAGWVDKAAPGCPGSWSRPGSTRRCARRWRQSRCWPRTRPR